MFTYKAYDIKCGAYLNLSYDGSNVNITIIPRRRQSDSAMTLVGFESEILIQ